MSLLPVLTSDNLVLSRPTNDALDPGLTPVPKNEINCTFLEARIAELVQASLAPNSRLAYAADLAAFRAWGGTLPATPEMVAAYVAGHADELNIVTLLRRLATLSRAHKAGGHPNPVASELVRAVMRGIRRTRSRPPNAAKALLKDQLFSVVDAMGETPRDTRDRALLLLGFAGAFRRSELVGLDFADLTRASHGLVITLRRSKTDPMAIGRNVVIAHGEGRYCPVAALERWLAVANITAGPIFRPVTRHGHVTQERLSGEAVAIVLRQRLTAVGINSQGYSGHSLRAGYVTDAVQRGMPTWRIRRQTGHASDGMLARYIRCAALSPESDSRALGYDRRRAGRNLIGPPLSLAAARGGQQSTSS
jgi:integrase